MNDNKPFNYMGFGTMVNLHEHIDKMITNEK